LPTLPLKTFPYYVLWPFAFEVLRQNSSAGKGRKLFGKKIVVGTI
jgi:hypothetical protein